MLVIIWNKFSTTFHYHPSHSPFTQKYYTYTFRFVLYKDKYLIYNFRDKVDKKSFVIALLLLNCLVFAMTLLRSGSLRLQVNKMLVICPNLVYRLTALSSEIKIKTTIFKRVLELSSVLSKNSLIYLLPNENWCPK